MSRTGDDGELLRVTGRLQGLCNMRCDSILWIVNSDSCEKAADVLRQFRGNQRGGSQVILEFLRSGRKWDVINVAHCKSSNG